MFWSLQDPQFGSIVWIIKKLEINVLEKSQTKLFYIPKFRTWFGLYNKKTIMRTGIYILEFHGGLQQPWRHISKKKNNHGDIVIDSTELYILLTSCMEHQLDKIILYFGKLNVVVISSYSFEYMFIICFDLLALGNVLSITFLKRMNWRKLKLAKRMALDIVRLYHFRQDVIKLAKKNYNQTLRKFMEFPYWFTTFCSCNQT